MSGRAILIGLAAILVAAPLPADFSYEQTTRITGGAMAGMMRLAGAFNKQAGQPMKHTVIVKGDRMVTLTPDTANIIDLSKETITDVNFKNRTYSVITFEQMRQALAALQEKLKSQQGGQQPNLDFKASVKETGQTKVVAGLNTKEVILTMEIQGRDQRSGQQGGMDVVADMWLAPSIPGYQEVRDFQRRMAAKMAWAPGMSGMGMNQPGMMKGMSDLAKEASKLDGVPVLQITRMGGSAQAMSDFSQPAGGAQGQQPEMPSAREAAGNAAGNAAGGAAAGVIGRRLGRLGGLGGGLGGLGRGRRQEQPQEPPPPPPQQQQQQQGAPQGAPGGGVLMESTTELSGFSSGPADGSKLEVPAGFKQVEHEMLKQSRR